MQRSICAVIVILLMLMGGLAMAGEGKTENAKPKVEIKYIYNMCNDVAPVRHFYTDLLGLNEVSFYESYWINYQMEGFCFMWFQTEKELPIPAEWMSQPGWEGGTLDQVSWSIVIPEEDFAAMIRKLKDAGVESFHDKPQWFQDSYWGFPVKDPMGNTVEIYCQTKERPESTEWPD